MDVVMWITFVPVITFVIVIAIFMALAERAAGRADSTNEDDNLW